MLKKVVKIENVGRLRKLCAAGDVAFRKLTVIFAENTRGKTTLCDILRSLKTGNPSPILARRTLGQAEEPFLELLWDDKALRFRDGVWSDTRPEIEIFDSSFVHENVYAGDVINHDHRKNLYRMLVGETAVNFAHEIERVDSQIRELGNRIRNTEAFLRAQASGDASLDDLISAEPIDNLDLNIERVEKEVQAEKSRAAVLSNEALSELDEYREPVNLERVLSSSLSTMGGDVERRVKLHRESHTSGASSSWLAEGLSFVKEATCPFCAQSLIGIDLIDSYRVLFGDEFAQLKKRITQVQQGASLLTAWEAGVRRLVDLNNQRLEFWKQVADVPARIELDVIASECSRAGEILARLVKRKSESPLSRVGEAEITELREAIKPINETVRTYNTRVRQSNGTISEVKSAASGPEVGGAEARLRQLKLAKLRVRPEVASHITERERLIAEQRSLASRKEELKNELNVLVEETLDGTEPRLNKLLARFGAGFRVGPIRRRFVGGRPSSAYELLINGVPVARTDEDGEGTEPRFKNTLSGGDRSCLALAFFFAKLETDPRLQDKVLIFDDPFGSQDSSRRAATRHCIWSLVERARQVIVLSHERGFLSDFYREYPDDSMKALRLSRIGRVNSTLEAWDPEEDALLPYLRDRRRLEKFVNDGAGELFVVARSIRPTLEGFLRRRLHSELQLRDLLRLIENAPDDSVPGQLKPLLLDMNQINEYGRRFMHDNGEAVDPAPAIDGGELSVFCSRVLALADPV